MHDTHVPREEDNNMNTETEVRPEVGMGATFTMWTDRYACTIIEVRRNGREVVLQRDKATLLNGFKSGEPDALEFSPGGFVGHTSGTQRHNYQRDPKGERIIVTRREVKNRDGSTRIVWKRKGDPARRPGGYAKLGIRVEHYDYNY